MIQRTADATERDILARRARAAAVTQRPAPAPVRIPAPATRPTPVSSTAAMYQQRIPTGPTTPTPAQNPNLQRALAAMQAIGAAASGAVRQGPVKQGPQGVTIDDVVRVAAGELTGWRPGQPLPSGERLEEARPASFDPVSIYGGVVGQPAPGYGSRYGGFKTATEFKNQVLGEAYNAKAVEALALEEAARLGGAYEDAYLRAINPEGAAVTMTAKSNQALARSPLSVLAQQMSGVNRRPTAEDYYGASMARMNAIRGTGDYGEQPMLANAIEMVRRPAEANLQAGLITSGAAKQYELADLIRAISPSDLARQIAVERYGQDPGMAAGVFEPTLDLEYENMMNDAYKAEIMRDYPGLDPNATTAEMILATQGPEALMQYQQQQAEYALYGTPTQQLAAEQRQIEAEEASFDDQIVNKYGFDPKEVSGVDATIVRDLASDETFLAIIDDARTRIEEGDDALNLASTIADEYLAQTGDNIGARALGEIIASFDVSFFG